MCHVTACREEDEIQTITYDEYVNAGIPDALLQGLGIALSQESVDAEDPDDSGQVTVEQTDTADDDVDNSSADIQPDPNIDIQPGSSVDNEPGPNIDIQPGPSVDIKPGPTVDASAEVVADSVLPVPVATSPVDDVVLPVIGGNSLELSSSLGSGYNNVVSDTPSAVNLVDKDGTILPTLPAITGLLGNIVQGSLPAWDGGKAASQAGVKYVDQNGRVVTCVPCPLSAPDASQVIRVVDSNGRVISGKEQPSTVVVDKDGRVISRTSTSPANVGNSVTNDVSEYGAGDFRRSLPASSIIQGVLRGLAPRHNSTEDSSRSNSACCLFYIFLLSLIHI